jgi:hypothetical protein
VPGRFANRSDGLLMIAMPDEDDVITLAGVADHFVMNLGHQRARRIDRFEVPLLR